MEQDYIEVRSYCLCHKDYTFFEDRLSSMDSAV